MRVAFFGQTGPYAPDALRHLLQHQGSYEIALVVEGCRTRPGGRHPHKLIDPHPGPLPTGEDLAAIGSAGGVPVLRTSEVNAPSGVRAVGAHDFDLLVCVGFDRLFHADLLATARRGGINAHPSKLPQLRGPSPIFWALKQGARRLAVTLHGLDARADHGPIYAQEEFVLPQRAAGDAIFTIAGGLAGRMLDKLLSQAAHGEITGLPQDDSLATRAPRPKPEDALVNPLEWRCEDLVNFACAAPFFRAAWMRLGDDTFFIRRGIVAEPGRRMPAQYMQQGERLTVQCGDGVAQLEIQV